MKKEMSDLTPRQREQIQALANLPDDQIDLSEVPETVDWSNAKRGAFYTPGQKHIGREIPSKPTDTTEKGLESLIVEDLTAEIPAGPAKRGLGERPASYGGGWIAGNPTDYDREYCVDLAQLAAFLRETQPEVADSLALNDDNQTRRKFLARLQGEIAKNGTTHVLRNGLKHEQHNIDFFYGTPTVGNPDATTRYGQNRFSVTRQLRYSQDNAQLALDLCMFINGLPVATFELKNSLTKQTVADAVEQYKRDRNPRENLFTLGRCLVHFAVDDNEVEFCTHLRGKESWFLPFNRGWNDGAGNPPIENGIKTDYLWKVVLTRRSLTNIIENYAQIIKQKDDRSGRASPRQIWPRYHQLDVVQKLLAHANENGVGQRYLIQHSAGSGKSNSIAWLVHQLIGLESKGKAQFDSVLVVTDRRLLDKQIKDTIKQFAQVGAVFGQAETSAKLGSLIQSGRRIITTTVQKFPLILDALGNEHRNRKFAIVIDEAHSSQGGRMSASVSAALGSAGADEDLDTTEDKINQLMESRKLLTNASYFAFTATPKNKTLEMFGTPVPDGDTTKHVPFHSYTMKQAIQEGFIVDVLKHYTQVDSYYRLVKTIQDDPEFDTKRASKKLRRYVENDANAVRLKAEIIVDHFHDSVASPGRIGGQARAMVVTGSIERAINYYHAIRGCLEERKSPFRPIVAFSGEHEYGGEKVSEASLNGFSSNVIAEKIQEDPYRILVCADKFQTGYDEPLMHTMYVDKPLSGVRAVQTLSRLNRSHPKKYDAFVLDFANKAETIESAFADYYRTTILAEETDPNKLHDLKSSLDAYQVYTPEQVNDFVEMFLSAVDRDRLDPILDRCVATYRDSLDEDGQVDFKSKAKGFLRSYAFLSSILPYNVAEWEKLSTFLNFLVPKLPAPEEDDLSKGILEAIDMDSYRAEKQKVQAIQLPDEDAEIDPVPTEGGGSKTGPDMNPLSHIIDQFNALFGDIEWRDSDKIIKLISEELPEKVANDKAYQNAMANSDEQNARIEHDSALQRAMNDYLADNTELYKQFTDNDSFRRWLAEMIFSATYKVKLA